MGRYEEVVKWKKTQKGNSRLDVENSFYLGRRIICRDSKICEGVSIGEIPREAIVVDYNNSKILQSTYQKIKESIEKERHNFFSQGEILKKVFDFTSSIFSNMGLYDVNHLLREYEIQEDKKVSLEIFISEGTGTCIHSSLTCGFLLEKLIEDDFLKGKASIDRNLLKIPGYGGGHAWCRYTDEYDDVYILDVSLNFFGHINEDGVCWIYNRPKDSKNIF